jgi:putative endonuclease
MSWFVYIIKCNDKSYYTGISTNLKRRVEEHNQGKYKSAYTKGRVTVRLVYWEIHEDRSGASKREFEIKGWSRSKKEKLINGLHRTN